jgi:hypothetical protein
MCKVQQENPSGTASSLEKWQGTKRSRASTEILAWSPCLRRFASASRNHGTPRGLERGAWNAGRWRGTRERARELARESATASAQGCRCLGPSERAGGAGPRPPRVLCARPSVRAAAGRPCARRAGAAPAASELVRGAREVSGRPGPCGGSEAVESRAGQAWPRDWPFPGRRLPGNAEVPAARPAGAAHSSGLCEARPSCAASRHALGFGPWWLTAAQLRGAREKGTGGAVGDSAGARARGGPRPQPISSTLRCLPAQPLASRHPEPLQPPSNPGDLPGCVCRCHQGGKTGTVLRYCGVGGPPTGLGWAHSGGGGTARGPKVGECFMGSPGREVDLREGMGEWGREKERRRKLLGVRATWATDILMEHARHLRSLERCQGLSLSKQGRMMPAGAPLYSVFSLFTFSLLDEGGDFCRVSFLCILYSASL